jgi:hypothetical protein
VVVIGGTLQILNKTYASVEPITYPRTLVADSEAGTRQGPDGQTYSVARAGGLSDVPDGSYLVDASGAIHYRLQPGIGSHETPAPQATLMSLVTKGILTQQLPWGFVLLGVFTSVLMEIIGVPALAFAVGMYLPLESTTPVFIGGLARRFVDWKRGTEAESDAGPGVLFSSGLVAGGSILGLLSSLLVLDFGFFPSLRKALAISDGTLVPSWISFPLFLVLAYLIYRVATRRSAAAE